ncbi:MAG: flagellin FliC [Proteobacteria bacterium]|nr:flagellin FliC [Pseudomonadota bacterium]MCP4921717.1 flagellin FliC [Pseudomonadota bacterium]
MAIVVNTNTASSNAINQLNKNNRGLQDSFRRISSGLRITKAADDAAGMGVAENLDSQVRSARVAARNTNDGISVIATAEGATTEVVNIIKRMRELAVQSSSETLDDDERAYIQDEYEQLSGEVDRIASVTNFNGVSLSDGTNTTIDVQVGVNNTANDRITITLGDLRGTVLGIDTASLDLSSATGAQSAIDALDTAMDTVGSQRSELGAVENRLDSALNNLEIYTENMEAAESRIRDADFAYETAEMAKNQIMQQAGTSVLAQAKSLTSGALTLLQG